MGVAQQAQHYGPALLLLTVLSGCGHRAPDTLMLVEVHEDLCQPEACVDSAARLEKLLTVQLALRSDCSRVQVFQSRDKWMLANTPPAAKHWTLTVSERFGRPPSQPTWLLAGPGKTYSGTGDPSKIIKDACARLD